MSGKLTNNAHAVMAYLEKNYPNFDKTEWFTRQELEKHFFLTVNKSSSYFRDVVKVLQAFEVFGEEDIGRFYLNQKKYSEFKKFVKGGK